MQLVAESFSFRSVIFPCSLINVLVAERFSFRFVISPCSLNNIELNKTTFPPVLLQFRAKYKLAADSTKPNQNPCSWRICSIMWSISRSMCSDISIPIRWCKYSQYSNWRTTFRRCFSRCVRAIKSFELVAFK